MGKNKGNKGKANNVFKVAGARSLKIKNKAKQVAGQLKKVSGIFVLFCSEKKKKRMLNCQQKYFKYSVINI